MPSRIVSQDRDSFVLAGASARNGEPVPMTEVFFRDRIAWSPDGHLEAVACSQANRPENNVGTPWPGIPAFSRDFVYTVTDTASGRVLWERRQQVGEPSPKTLHVSDRGELVVEVDGGFLVHSCEGHLVSELDLVRDFLQGDQDTEHLEWSTAGYKWPAGTLSYFYEDDEVRAFLLLTGTDLRCGADLVTGAPAGLGEAWDRRLLNLEEDVLVQVLERGPEPEERLWPLETAVILAGLRKVRAAVPLLQALESVAGTEDTVPSLAFQGEGRWTVSARRLRARVQLALLRLGVTPRGYATYLFENEEGRFELPECLPDRELRAGEVEPGMSAVDVLLPLGSPNHIAPNWFFATTDEDSVEWWDYDLQDEERTLFTLRLVFVPGQKGVHSLLTVRPPDWQNAGGRARGQRLF